MKITVNSSDAFTAEVRAYDNSMQGLFGIYTPIGPEVGVNRSMVVNPKIDSVRGTITKLDLENADATNLFSIGEMLNVFTGRHSDAPRAVMATVQGKHLTPTKNQTPYIVGNGSDKVLPYFNGQDFSYKAVDDGVIESIDEKHKLCTIRYTDGTKSIIDLRGRAAKNSSGGFFIETRLQLVKGVKVGTKVKKGQILAIDDSYYKPMLDGAIGFAAGSLTKIAVAALPETFEDSGLFTRKTCDNLSSEIINERRLNLGKNTRLIKMAKIGDKVKVNDPLLVFEEVGEDEELALKALEKMDAITNALANEKAHSTAKSKYSGEIFDIKVYYNCDLEDMHPTLRKFVENYVSTNKAKSKILDGVREDEIVYQDSTDKIESEKILGDVVDGVLIQFYIKHVDKFGVGDKACFAIALKTICAETIDDEEAPFSEYRPDESIDAIISPLSLVSRMVPDLYLLGYTNKAIIELERQCLDLLEE